jgi:hypothetical protein
VVLQLLFLVSLFFLHRIALHITDGVAMMIYQSKVKVLTVNGCMANISLSICRASRPPGSGETSDVQKLGT